MEQRGGAEVWSRWVKQMHGADGWCDALKEKERAAVSLFDVDMLCVQYITVIHNMQYYYVLSLIKQNYKAFIYLCLNTYVM